MSKYTNAITKGISTDIIIFVLTIIINFALIPFYLNYITMEEFGIFISIQALVAFISLADIGMPMYSTRIMSEDNFFFSDRLKVFIYSSQVFQYILGLILLLIGILVCVNIDVILNIKETLHSDTQMLFIFSWFSIVIGIWFGLNHAVFKSRHELLFLNSCIFAILVLTSIFNIFFLIYGFGIAYLGVSLFIATLIINLFLTFKLYYKYKLCVFSPSSFEIKYIKNGWKYIKHFQVLRMAQVLKTSLFTVFINNVGGQVLVAQYNISNKVPQMLPGIFSKVIGNFMPSMSQSFLTNDISNLSKSYSKIFTFFIKLTILTTLAILLLNKDFVSLWVGENKFIDMDIFYLLLINMVIMSIFSFIGIVVHSSGKFEKLSQFAIIESVLFLLLALSLPTFFGVKGVFYAFIISSLISLLYHLFLISKILELNIYKLLFKSLLSSVLPSIIIVLLLWLVTFIKMPFLVNFIISSILVFLVIGFEFLKLRRNYV